MIKKYIDPLPYVILSIDYSTIKNKNLIYIDFSYNGD